MKCELCGGPIGHTFLKKIVGAYVKDGKGKRHVVCSQCQRTQGEAIRGKFA